MAFGKTWGKKFGCWKRRKNLSQCPRSFLSNSRFAVRNLVVISSEEQNISKPRFSNKGDSQGDGLKGKRNFKINSLGQLNNK